MIIHGRQTGSIQNLAARLQDCNVQLRWGGPQVAWSGTINGQIRLLDGLEQLKTLQAAGIKIPGFKEQTDYGWQFPPGLWLARRRHHTQGRDILVVGGPRQRGRRSWQNSDFFVKYIPDAVREWRFHILYNKSIARGLKVSTDTASSVRPIIRSRRNGWRLRHDVTPSSTLRELAKAAVAAVGYDLGAVDLLEMPDGSGIVLEINSRPGIKDNYTLSRYEQAFRNL